jgi:hypothetical protein
MPDVLHVEYVGLGQRLQSVHQHRALLSVCSRFASCDLERVRGQYLNDRNRPHHRWSCQLYVRNVPNCGSRFKYSRTWGQVEQRDPGFQNL